MPFLVGIGGGTGTGKTALALCLCEHFQRRGVALLDMDSYYLDRSDLNTADRATLNFDEPSAIDRELLTRHIKHLLGGSAVEKPRYSFITHTRNPEVDVIRPEPLILLEGLFALSDPTLCAHMGLKVFLDASPDIRFIRKLRRDLEERGRNVESVVAQYLTSVRPMHYVHVEPTRPFADLVVDTSGGILGQTTEAVARVIHERMTF